MQAGGGGVMVCGMFSWHTLGPLVPIGQRLNATAYLSIVSDISIHLWSPCTHPLMATSSFVTCMCIPQISIKCKVLSYQYGPTFLKNAS